MRFINVFFMSYLYMTVSKIFFFLDIFFLGFSFKVFYMFIICVFVYALCIKVFFLRCSV